MAQEPDNTEEQQPQDADRPADADDVETQPEDTAAAQADDAEELTEAAAQTGDAEELTEAAAQADDVEDLVEAAAQAGDAEPPTEATAQSDVEALMEAAENAAAVPVPDPTEPVATEDVAEIGNVASPGDAPAEQTEDAFVDSDAGSGELDQAALDELLAAAGHPTMARSPAEPDVGAETPPPVEEAPATEQTVPDSPVQVDAVQEATPEPPPGTTPFEPPPFDATAPASHASQLDLLDDVELEVKVELGRTEMYIEDVLGLGAGSVVELDKGAGDPVDILVNERLVARGEVLVLNESFCVRINDILSPVPELDEKP